MRITQNIITSGSLLRYQQNLRDINDAQQRVSSGMRILKASDDPVGTASSMQARSSLRALEQYRRNIEISRTRADAEERVFDQLSDVLTRARELAISQGTETADASTRLTVKAEVDQLLGFVVQLGNTKIAGSHIFGGADAGVPPVSWDDESLPPEITLDDVDPGHHSAEISAGMFVRTTNNAHDVFGDGEVYESLWNLSQALGANDDEAIRKSIDGLNGAFEHVQALIGDVGARAAQLQVTSANIDALEINLLTFKSNLEEVDFEQAVTELISRQTTFQAAMLATSRVMGMTMMDYLR